MSIVIGILVVLIILLGTYLLYVQLQIRSMSRQLDKRLKDNTRQPISLELINKDLNHLAVNINRSLKAEENLRLTVVRDEKKFREMIANISHDLRTPLTAIRGYQQLLSTSELSDDQSKKLGTAMKYTEELGQLVERFFEYSYLLNAEPKMQIERFNLTKLVTECLVSFVTVFEEQGLAICFEEDTPPMFVTADRELTTRILQNLIRNCIAHSAGTIRVQIIKEKEVILSFQNPVKIPEEIDASRLFERFYTGDHARRHSTGLGLAIVKLLAEQMDGSVSASLTDGILDIRVMLKLSD